MVFDLHNNSSNLMEHSPFWETDSSSASQGFSQVLANPKMRFSVPKGARLISIINFYCALRTDPMGSVYKRLHAIVL